MKITGTSHPNPLGGKDPGSQVSAASTNSMAPSAVAIPPSNLNVHPHGLQLGIGTVQSRCRTSATMAAFQSARRSRSPLRYRASEGEFAVEVPRKGEGVPCADAQAHATTRRRATAPEDEP